MKAELTKKLIASLNRKTPSFIVKVQCQILLDLMAKTCGKKRESLLALSKEETLKRYGEYTKKCMAAGDCDPDKLYQEAYKLGRKINQFSGLKQDEDKEELIYYLYSNIDITMKGKIPGEIVIPHCYFAKIYTPKECALMSKVDEGIIAGIMGKGTLRFSQRLSEGCQACKACFEKEENA